MRVGAIGQEEVVCSNSSGEEVGQQNEAGADSH
jgi:hypothetical protein